MTLQDQAVGRRAPAPRSIPVHPVHETVLGTPCYKSIFDVPGDLDLAVILTGQAVESFDEVLQRGRPSSR